METQSSDSSSHSDSDAGKATVVSNDGAASNQTSKSTLGDSDKNQTSQDSNAGYGVDSSEPVPDVRQSYESDYVEGYEMQKEEPVQAEESGGLFFSGSDIVGFLFVAVAVGGIYMGFRKKKI